MKTVARRLPALPIALAAALLTAFLIVAAPLSASAHDSLTASSPEADSTVETLPSELTLTFSADLVTGDGATEVVVTDPSGQTVTTDAATTSGAIVTQPLAAEAPAGVYHVIWKVVSSDGHPTSGEFDFTVSTPSVPAPTPAPTEEATQEPPVTATEPAVPSPTASASATSAPAEDSPASAGIWILSIVGGLLLIAAVVAAFFLKRRSGAAADPADDSDAPSER